MQYVSQYTDSIIDKCKYTVIKQIIIIFCIYHILIYKHNALFDVTTCFCAARETNTRQKYVMVLQHLKQQCIFSLFENVTSLLWTQTIKWYDEIVHIVRVIVK